MCEYLKRHSFDASDKTGRTIANTILLMNLIYTKQIH